MQIALSTSDGINGATVYLYIYINLSLELTGGVGCYVLDIICEM